MNQSEAHLHSMCTEHFCPSLSPRPSSLVPRLGGGGIRREHLTGTFFCVMTTAESLPRTPMEVMPPWLIALKAYSGEGNSSHMHINHTFFFLRCNQCKQYLLFQNLSHVWAMARCITHQLGKASLRGRKW